jgi:hypothetical protein
LALELDRNKEYLAERNKHDANQRAAVDKEYVAIPLICPLFAPWMLWVRVGAALSQAPMHGTCYKMHAACYMRCQIV